MNNTKNTIAKILNILRAGNIIDCTLNNGNLKLTVEISFDSTSKKFYLLINQCSNVNFIPWPHYENDNIKIINTELDILKKYPNANTIEIMCQTDENNYPVGGILTFNAMEVLLFMEDNTLISVEELEKVVEKYLPPSKS